MKRLCLVTRCVTTLVCLLTGPFIACDAANLLVTHVPAAGVVVGAPLNLSASVTGGTEPITVTLFYRIGGASSFVSTPMTGAGNQFSGSVPGSQVTERGIEYFIVARDAKGNMGSFPPGNPEAAPLRVAVLGTTRTSAMKVLYPEDGGKVDSATPAIGASFVDPSNLDMNSVKLFLDEVDVSTSSEMSEEYILYIPDAPLTMGRHVVRVEAKTPGGTALKPLNWWFEVAVGAGGEAVRAIEYSGTATVTLQTARIDNPKWEQYSSYVPTEPQGSIEYEVNMSGKSADTTFVGWLSRRKELYSYRSIDRGRWDLYQKNVDLTFGDFWPTLTNLTLPTLEARGFRVVDHNAGGQWTLLGARTYSTSYYQQLWGTRYEGKLTPKLTLGTSAVMVQDQGAKVPQASGPISAKAIGADSTYIINNQMSTSAEWVRSTYNADTSVATDLQKDTAVTWLTKYRKNRLSLSGTYLDLGRNFFPVASPYFENDKKGIDSTAEYMIEGKLYASANWAQSKRSEVAGQTPYIKNKSVLLSLTPTESTTLTGSYNKLTKDSPDTLTPGQISTFNSTVKSASLSHSISSFWVLGDTLLSLNVQKMNFNNTTNQSITSNYDMSNMMWRVNTSYKDKVILSLSRMVNDLDDLGQLRTISSRSKELGITWNIIPFKLVSLLGYELNNNYSNDNPQTLKNDRRTWKARFNYYLSRSRSVSLGYQYIAFRDPVDNAPTGFNYGEKIFFTSLSTTF